MSAHLCDEQIRRLLGATLPDDELLSEFLPQFYGSGRPIPAEVLLPSEAYGRAGLEDWFTAAVAVVDGEGVGAGLGPAALALVSAP